MEDVAVNGTEYRMWARLAQREDLPEAAFCTVVDGLLPDDGRFKQGGRRTCSRRLCRPCSAGSASRSFASV